MTGSIGRAISALDYTHRRSTCPPVGQISFGECHGRRISDTDEVHVDINTGTRGNSV